jgi:hypothetical protein
MFLDHRQQLGLQQLDVRDKGPVSRTSSSFSGASPVDIPWYVLGGDQKLT